MKAPVADTGPGMFGLRAKTMVGSLLPIALSILLAAVGVVGMRTLYKTNAALDRAHKGIEIGRAVEAAALEAKGSLHEFMLTDNASYLEAYRSALKRYAKVLEEAKSVAAGKPGEESILRADRELGTWKSDVADPAVAAAQKQRPELKLTKVVELDSRSRELYKKVADILEESSTLRSSPEPATVQPAPVNPTEQPSTSEPPAVQPQVKTQHDDPADSAVPWDVLRLVGESQLALGTYIASGDKGSLETFQADRRAALDLIGKAKQQKSANPALLPLFVRVETLLAQWYDQVDVPRIKWREQESLEKKVTGMEAPGTGKGQGTHFARFQDAVNRYVDRHRTRLEALRKKASRDFGRTTVAIVLLALLVAVAAIVKNFVLTGRTTRPLMEALSLAEAVSRGDLRGTVDVTESDEVGRLGKSLNMMVRVMKEQILRVVEGVSVLSSSSASISATVEQLSLSTSKTAAAVAETTTTVEQLKQAAQVSSDKARNVAETSQEVVRISEAGLMATEETARKIHQIKGQMEAISQAVVALNERAEAIQGVIVTVQDLADQSNLLAVNASIEAARAGEHGKGFAVVAHEIKSLADQSKQATTQVRELLSQVRHSIGAVVTAADFGAKAVDSGVEQSSSAGESIRALSGRVAESSEAASVIETTSRQQFLGIDQVSVAMGNVEQVMRETLEGTSRLEDAARKLQVLGEQLGDLVDRYKL